MLERARQDGWREGRAEGMEEGLAEGWLAGAAEAREEAMQEGIRIGRNLEVNTGVLGDTVQKGVRPTQDGGHEQLQRFESEVAGAVDTTKEWETTDAIVKMDKSKQTEMSHSMQMDMPNQGELGRLQNKLDHHCFSPEQLCLIRHQVTSRVRTLRLTATLLRCFLV